MLLYQYPDAEWAKPECVAKQKQYPPLYQYRLVQLTDNSHQLNEMTKNLNSSHSVITQIGKSKSIKMKNDWVLVKGDIKQKSNYEQKKSFLRFIRVPTMSSTTIYKNNKTRYVQKRKKGAIITELILQNQLSSKFYVPVVEYCFHCLQSCGRQKAAG